ncbi:MAG: DUF5606 domain-containing protein [Saprospiraceae bacterium]|nr:DUF5606 domain-containing protein [Saprospiraceae bacterium]
MNLEKIMAVSGHGTLFRLVSARNNGLILEDLSNRKQNFYSSRIHQFSPLDSIGIYTLSDNIPLKEVYEKFLASDEVPEHTAEPTVIKEFFEKTLPEYDRYRVHIKDMKKCLKWFYQLKEMGLLYEENKKENEEEE